MGEGGGGEGGSKNAVVRSNQRSDHAQVSNALASPRGYPNWPLPNLAGSRGESIPQWRSGSFGGTGFERGQANMPRQYNCYVPDCINIHSCSGTAFWLGTSACPVLPHDSKCLNSLLILIQFSPTGFGNGQFAWDTCWPPGRR